jgi:monofunctional biosynthetic peptidoglycan transglycosylase
MPKVRWRKILKIAILALLLVFALGIGYNLLVPDIARLRREAPKITAFMEYRQSHPGRRNGVRPLDYRWVPLESISPYLRNAVVIAEDDKFWNHNGFDFGAIKIALETNIQQKSWRHGGSTITQQLAKNLYLSPSRNPVRKLREIILTWRLERALSKKRILELYLNVVEWGNGIFGAEAASQRYYGKPAAALNPREAAHLAIVLPSPRRYNPLSGSSFIENRAEDVLAVMIKRGIAPAEEDGEKPGEK